jgi:hypothetical protein
MKHLIRTLCLDDLVGGAGFGVSGAACTEARVQPATCGVGARPGAVQLSRESCTQAGALPPNSCNESTT